MDLNQFLVWLTTSAGYSAAYAFIAERIPAFQKLTPAQKSIVSLIVPLAIALAAYAAMTYVPAETLNAIRPIFLLVSTVIGSWIAGQVAHSADPAA